MPSFADLLELSAAEQENLWKDWWCEGTTEAVGGACDGVRNYYDDTRVGASWVAVQPTPFALGLIVSEFTGILLQDGLKTLIPFVFTFGTLAFGFELS